MMKKHLLTRAMILTLSAFSLVGFTGCGDDDDDEEVSRTELLTNNAWIAVEITSDPAYPISNTVATNVFPQLPACFRDNVVNFNDNGTYTYEERDNDCDNVTTNNSLTGTWAFNSDETGISLSGGLVGNLEVEELEEDVFVYEEVFPENGVSYTWTWRLEPAP